LESPFRPLTTRERELVERLLEPDFPGRDELRRQLESVTAKQIFEDGTLALQCGPSEPAPVRCRVPTEGECPDADGMGIHVLLHVKVGVMHELEVFKDDGSPIRNPPVARDLVLFTPYGDAGVKWGAEDPAAAES
jgi:hypothetical protein